MAQTAGQKNDGSVRPASADVGDQVPELRFKRMPRPGEPAPWFRVPTPENPNFSFDTVGRRWRASAANADEYGMWEAEGRWVQ
jgi:hypothetical protein